MIISDMIDYASELSVYCYWPLCCQHWLQSEGIITAILVDQGQGGTAFW